ncbi:hypothetical protein BP6252_09166 [Coleophoma cylindrospora]|uniref:Uncharacterized protein n=1 Tax=Coleophoma cylindrospora TaxID=1849047 RepID=A0A3D8R1F5_9HELO|nr:hypothetical protein BP6252_09166 [Coleophoma cylindrospora]
MLRTLPLRSCALPLGGARRALSTTPRCFKGIPEATQTTPGKKPETMSNKAAKKAKGKLNEMENSSKPVFNKDGAIGKEFKKDGAVGSIGEKIGGVFASDGAVGKNFNPDGAVGKTVNEELGKKK